MTEAEGFEAEIEAYYREYPYQETFDYASRYTGGDPGRLNTWVVGEQPVLVRAGDDKVVRMNNDTYYRIAYIDLTNGPVVLGAAVQASDRFASFQLMDDRNANYHNILQPSGQYTLHHGPAPADVVGEAIEVPTLLSVAICRVEVKDKNDPADTATAAEILTGFTIDGPTIDEFPVVDRLSRFSDEVVAEANRRLDQAFKDLPFIELVVGPGLEPGVDVPFMMHAAGTMNGWGGPGPAHSAYETVFNDANGDPLDGSKGVYTVTTTEPPVDAFWSVTVYDTARGGHLHPNADDRYHINNNTAVMNPDGTITFTFATSCDPDARNCLEVPAGPFDIAPRYYLPHEPIISGNWTFPGLELEQ
jgi:hypothetical protein